LDINGKNNCGFMSREEWIKEAKKKGYSENKIDELCFYIKNHATDIDISKVNSTNYKRYAKLLTIQYCDCSAYNPTYVREGMAKLDKIKNNLIDKRNEMDENIK
jgi:hypothetical protein